MMTAHQIAEKLTDLGMVSRSPTVINAAKTHCARGHPFSGDNLIVGKRGDRRCRECGRADRQKYNRKIAQVRKRTLKITDAQQEMINASSGFVDEETARRVWSKVDVRCPDECWEWTEGVGHGGYGRTSIGARKVTAHRLSLMIKLGREITDGQFALHSCDNPPCVNPAHLREGTSKENSEDAVCRNRMKKWRGERAGQSNPRAKLTEKDVREIRSLRHMKRADVAALFGVSQPTISGILNGYLWKDII